MKCYLGIDISKNFLDVHIRPAGIKERFQYDNTGIRLLITLLKEYSEIFVVLEATGGYERTLSEALSSESISYHIANPARVREFARATGKLAKTNRIDAEILSLFAEKIELPISTPKSKDEILLKALIMRKTQIKSELVREKNRLDKTIHPIILEDIKSQIKALQEKITKYDSEIKNLISTLDNFSSKAKIIASVPGIGCATAAILVSELPKLGKLNGKQIAALVGVAPMNWDSGGCSKKRSIKAGRTFIRHSLYMATVVAITHNPKLKEFYQ
ncbi:IS110 family transposase, partial [Candidatus Jidaibacter acanthamoebae]